ncbi:hypothetical protein [Clostridium sp. CMCC3677]|uniref:hypothetical protein n=1 Tax=Clostridium sp. CMCC3677 TaxID=2949963 RepID=UPI0013F0145C|nr:hypothetical protein [Clostridium sp. CMCC3677]NFG62394.1 hypothetical protein [Clostridium botulinum]NFO15472.1 hypothetical protein [Clostridium botulinum]NFQ10245.1 hypothetical protein [Clostridium botulinum]
MNKEQIKQILTGFNDDMRVLITEICNEGEVIEPITEDRAEYILDRWNNVVDKLGAIGIQLESEI